MLGALERAASAPTRPGIGEKTSTATPMTFHLFFVMRSHFASCLAVAVVVLTSSLAGPASAADDDGLIATTTAGKVRGYTSAGVLGFKGIPYGGDTAQRRFQAPRPIEPWTGVRDAKEFAHMAPQPAGTSPRSYSHGYVPQGEDCLNLNVWTPALRDGHKRPVFVYLHGGGFDTLSANQVDGTQLSRRGDAVVVGVNHRLNGFGFLFLGDLGDPEFAGGANAGLLDIVLSLQWIHDNIAEFGGDPGGVTIFGESGGAAKCTMLMTMPAAKGLFHRVWTMSGAGLSGLTRERATTEARAVLEALGLTPDRIAEIKTLPMDRLVKALGGRAWAPVVDGTILPRAPFWPDAPPLSAGIPMVIGSTHDEMMPFLEKNPAFADLSWEKLAELTKARFRGEPSAEKIVATYRQLYPKYSPRDVAFAIATDAGIWRDTIAEADRRAAQGGPTFVYHLNWPGGGRAAHALDLWLALADPKLNWRTNRESNAQDMADVVSEAFLAFGRTGDPNTAKLPRWPNFNVTERPTMIFDLPPRVENDPRSAERKLFGPK